MDSSDVFALSLLLNRVILTDTRTAFTVDSGICAGAPQNDPSHQRPSIMFVVGFFKQCSSFSVEVPESFFCIQAKVCSLHCKESVKNENKYAIIYIK